MFLQMNTTLFLLTLCVTALISALFGWLFGSRAGVALRAERDKFESDFRRAVVDLATESEARQAAVLALGRVEAAQAARDAAHAAQLQELRANRDALAAQFAALGAQMLEAAQAQFLDRADARFKQSEAVSGAALKAMLAPVEGTLKRYEDGLKLVEKDRVESYAGLREAVEQVKAGQAQVRDETVRLVNALRSSPKARGRWGEQQLRNVLEMAGLSEHADFQTEVSVADEEGQHLRPDVIVRLPGGKRLIIDAKCALNAYLDASEARDDASRIIHLRAHAASMRTHAQQLGAKSYWSRFGDAADYVVMFIPGEHFLSAALEQDNALWEWAFERKVLLATPTNLIAIARTVSAVWRQEKMTENAKQIEALGKELYERLAKVSEHFGKAGASLNNAVTHFNRATTSFNTRLVPTGKKFRDLDATTVALELTEVSAVDALAVHAENSHTDDNRARDARSNDGVVVPMLGPVATATL